MTKFEFFENHIDTTGIINDNDVEAVAYKISSDNQLIVDYPKRDEYVKYLSQDSEKLTVKHTVNDKVDTSYMFFDLEKARAFVNGKNEATKDTVSTPKIFSREYLDGKTFYNTGWDTDTNAMYIHKLTFTDKKVTYLDTSGDEYDPDGSAYYIKNKSIMGDNKSCGKTIITSLEPITIKDKYIDVKSCMTRDEKTICGGGISRFYKNKSDVLAYAYTRQDSSVTYPYIDTNPPAAIPDPDECEYFDELFANN